MCVFNDYLYVCRHPAVKHAFCTAPCPRYAELAKHGNSLSQPGCLNPNNLTSGCRCPDMQTDEHKLPYACKDCARQPQYRRFANPAAIPIRTEGTIWHIPETPINTQYMRSTDPWADDREEEGRADGGWRRRRREEERRCGRSVSPRGRHGSGVDPAAVAAGTHTGRGGCTSWRTSQEALQEVKAKLRELRHGLSEMQISQLVVDHPHEHARRPVRGEGPSSPGEGRVGMKHGGHR
jgi:hypothetical protein